MVDLSLGPTYKLPMYVNYQNRIWASISAGIIGLCVALTVLMGWVLDVSELTTALPGLPAMIPMTATAISLLSISLIFSAVFSKNKNVKIYRLFATTAALFALCFSFLAYAWHFFDFDPGLSQNFLVEPYAQFEKLLLFGHMSLQTGTATLTIAIALLLFQYTTLNRSFLFFQILLIIPITLTLLAAIGYVHGINFQGPSKFVGFSVPSVFAFFVIAVGGLSLIPDRGIIGTLRKKSSKGVFLRWYTSFGLIFPILTTVVIQWGVQNDLYPPAFSSALFVVVMIASLLVLGYFMSLAMQRLETQRRAIEQAQAKAALRESEESLRETKERLEMSLDYSKMGTWETKLPDNKSFWSETAERIFGYSPATFSEDPSGFSILIHPEDRDYVARAYSEAIQNNTDLDIDFRFQHPDGRFHWLRSKGRAKYDENGHAIRLTGTIADVTTEKQYQETLEKALQEAEGANKIKSSFLANMSHEIRTPLGAILGFTDLLSDPSLPVEERNKYLKTIARNGENLAQILNDILDLSKVESGHLDVEKIRFSLKATLNEITSLLEFKAQEKGISLSVQYEGDRSDQIISDPTRLKQILINLVGNAIKFTTVGGVSIKVLSSPSQISFEITDTGIGIEEAQKSKLFQSFSQLHSSTTRLYGGTGLGLALSRKLANLLGGTIELKNTVLNQGSTFTVSIKNGRPDDVQKIKTEIRTIPPQSLKGVQVLLAEDSPDNQSLISFLLTKEGAHVDVAQNGQECLDKAQDKKYDLILMDIQMPVLDGYEATKQLRDKLFTVPIIALTAHAMSDVHQKCLDIGCNGHLTKPLNKHQLIQTIHDFTRI